MSGEASEKEENRKAKLQSIEAYFEDLERRSDFLDKLDTKGHRSEGLLLCCCYIEALGGNLYWPDGRSARNFVRLLKEHGGEEVLWHIHPKQLRIGLTDARSKLVQGIGQKLDKVLAGAEGRLCTEEQILTLVEPFLTADELDTLKQNLWRGTLAALVYGRVRGPLVHQLSTRHGVSLDQTIFKGELVPDLDARILYPVLRRVIRGTKELSLASGKWYGHDFKAPVESDRDM